VVGKKIQPRAVSKFPFSKQTQVTPLPFTAYENRAIKKRIDGILSMSQVKRALDCFSAQVNNGNF